MKALFILVLSVFVVVSFAHATPAPVNKSLQKGGKSVSTKTVKGSKKSVKTNKKSAAVTQKYKVKSGDNLYTIAKRQGMKLADLQRLNGLKSSSLKPGQVLLVTKNAKKSGKHKASEIVEESGELISQIAFPGENGLFLDSLAEVGVEPIARTYLSIPYRYGAESRKSTDCSGFVQQVFREFDIKLPRTAREQFKVGMKIDRSSLSSGDLLFFRTRARKKYPTHVGIYLGNGKMIHASSRQHKVVISDVNHPYYVKRYVGAKRTATFLPGEIDLEMLARQVTGLETDAPLAGAIVADVHEEIEVPSVLEAGLHNEQAQQAGEAVYEDNHADVADEVDDIDGDVEPEPEAIIAAPPMLGTLSSPILPNAVEVASAAVIPLEEQNNSLRDNYPTGENPVAR